MNFHLFPLFYFIVCVCFFFLFVLFPSAVNITFDEFNDRELLIHSIIIYFWPF